MEAVRYVGFAVLSSGREYEFHVAGTAGEPERVFTVWIATADFRPGRLKFQEGPDIAVRKLRTLLALPDEGTPVALHQELSSSEITDFTAKAPSKAKALTEEQRLAARQIFRNRPH